MAQFKAYCILTGTSPTIDKAQTALVRFGIGKKTSLGMATIDFPVSDIWLSFDMHVVNGSIPMLTCVDEMNKNDIYFKNVTNTLVHTVSGCHASIIRTKGHAFLLWVPVATCHFSTTEAHRLHHRFGHASADKLANFLSRTELDDV